MAINWDRLGQPKFDRTVEAIICRRFKDTAGNRTLTIGEVYAVHSAATAVNADDAVEARKSGKGKGFRVNYRPSDDPFFYLALADGATSELLGNRVALWSLVGVDQPGISAVAIPTEDGSEPSMVMIRQAAVPRVSRPNSDRVATSCAPSARRGQRIHPVRRTLRNFAQQPERSETPVRQ